MRKHKKEELFDLVPRAALGRFGEKGFKKKAKYIREIVRAKFRDRKRP